MNTDLGIDLNQVSKPQPPQFVCVSNPIFTCFPEVMETFCWKSFLFRGCLWLFGSKPASLAFEILAEDEAPGLIRGNFLSSLCSLSHSP